MYIIPNSNTALSSFVSDVDEHDFHKERIEKDCNFGTLVFVKLSIFLEFVYFQSCSKSGTHVQRKSLLCHSILQVLVVSAAISTINRFIANVQRT